MSVSTGLSTFEEKLHRAPLVHLKDYAGSKCERTSYSSFAMLAARRPRGDVAYVDDGVRLLQCWEIGRLGMQSIRQT